MASLALVVFQIYWIGYTARSNNEVFGANVREAMQQVVRKLEKQELVYLTQIKTAEDTKRRELLAISSQQNQMVKKQKAQSPRARKKNTEEYEYASTVAPSDMLNLNAFQILNRALPIDEISIQLNVENPSFEEAEAIYRFNEFVGRQLQSLEGFQIDSSAFVPKKKRPKPTRKPASYAQKATKPSNPKIDKLAQKSEIMKDVFSEYLLKERPIGERINRIGLDSMLHAEILARGIDIPMEYGIALKHDTSSLHYLSNPKISLDHQKLIKNQGFKASLFPNDMFSSDNQLYVYFPDRKDFIRKSIWMNILGSVAMISIVLGCFYVAVNTILKQKKLADIKNDFINNMTHEFKTPISTISLACEVLGDRELQHNQGVLSRYLGIIKDENHRLGNQVEKVLQTALLDRGNVKMNLSTLNINDIISKAVDNIAPQIELKGGSISYQPHAHNSLVVADAVHLSNVIFNLIDNAVKYAKEKPEVTITTENIDGEIKITCADKGLGIAPEHLKNVFEKFYRVPTGNLHDVKGFGLGLSYVKKIVEEQKGRVMVQSRLGEGSEFSIILPNIQQTINA